MTDTTALYAALFDDAAMFPPADLKMPAALRQHARHRLAWYADTVGPFVCNARWLDQLAAQAQALGLAPLPVAAVVSDGIGELGRLRARLAGLTQVSLQALEVPLKNASLPAAMSALEPFVAGGVPCYLEVPVGAVDDRTVHDLGRARLRLKLRTGGTSIDAFSSEAHLAVPIVACAAERLQFKCTAGLHNAVRHRDEATGFEHHGFLNVALAARVAAATGNAAATAAVLADTDPLSVQSQVRALTDRDVAAVRAMFCSFGTCSIDEPIADLVAMGLVTAR
ncbi:MAG: hypothetical protein EPN43_04620 [Jatrophihabitans sp.]|nr:MAG: hypothetical protein EPN43_04620 [Jatrophihabitans sp.]